MAAKGKLLGSSPKKQVDLVLEGGGVKGLALVGALAAIEKAGYVPQNIAGVSVGAIVGALLAAGYTAAELRDIMLNRLDFRRFKDLGLEASVPVVGKPINLLMNLGIYEGRAIEKEIEQLLAAKNVRTFKDLLYEGDDADQKDVYSYRLQVIVSDLTLRRMLVLPRDAELLGLDPDELSVACAVRMSMSVPVFFEPITVVDHHEVTHYIVDGGLLSNFPVWVFDSDDIPAWPTFGLHLVNAFEVTGLTDRIPRLETATARPDVLLRSFLLALGFTALEAHDWLYIEQENFARTIPIPTLGVGLLDFGISREMKRELYRSGFAAAEDFLKRWDFMGYIAEFRSGKEHSRRAQVARQMQAPEPLEATA